MTYHLDTNRLERFVTRDGTIVEPAPGRQIGGPSLSPDGIHLLTTQRDQDGKREVHLTNLVNNTDTVVFNDNGIPYFAWSNNLTFFASRSEVGEQGRQMTVYRHTLDNGESAPYVTLPVSDFRMPLAIKRHWLAFRCPKEPTNPQSPSEICYIDILHGFQDQYIRVTDSESDGFEFEMEWLLWDQDDSLLLPCKPSNKSKYAVCSVNLLTDHKTNVLLSEDTDVSGFILGPGSNLLLSSGSVYNLQTQGLTRKIIPSSFDFEGETIYHHLSFFAWEQ